MDSYRRTRICRAICLIEKRCIQLDLYSELYSNWPRIAAETIRVNEDDTTAAHVLGICQKTDGGEGFTLPEIIACIVEERPDMILDFSRAWGVLIRSRKVRILNAGDPPTYEIIHP